jgi:hypothetical protein
MIRAKRLKVLPSVDRAPYACLACGYVFDCASGVGVEPFPEPREGSLSLCIHCGHVAAFNGQGGLRPLTADERLYTETNLATCSHALAELERRRHCSVCGAYRERTGESRRASLRGEWQPTKLGQAAIALDEDFMLAGVQWGPETTDADEVRE